MEIKTIETRKNNAMMRTFCMLMLVCVCFLTIPGTFCTEGDAVTNVSNVFIEMITDMSSQIYTTMRAVAIPIIACFVAYAGFCALTGGARGVEKCVDILKKCVAAACLVAFAPLLAQQLGNWVKNSGTGDLSEYNPLA